MVDQTHNKMFGNRADWVRDFSVPAPLWRALAIALGLGCLALVGLWAFIKVVYSVDVPVWDQWDKPMSLLIRAQTGGLTIDDLLEQHNEARKFFPNLASLLLSQSFGVYDVRNEVFLGHLLMVGLAGLIIWKARLYFIDKWYVYALASAFLYISILSSTRAFELNLMSISFERFLPEICLLLSLIWVGRAPRSFAAILSAAGLCAVAQFSFPSGVVVWLLVLALILVQILVLRERPAGHLVLLLAPALASNFLFWQDYESHPHHSSPLAIFDQSIGDIVEFFIVFLGSCIADEREKARAWGAFILGLFVLVTSLRVRRLGIRGMLRTDTAWVLLALYSLSQAALATITRLPMESSNALRPEYIAHGAFIYVATAAMLMALFTQTRPQAAAGPNVPAGRPDTPLAAFLAVLLVFGLGVANVLSVAQPDFWRALEARQSRDLMWRSCVLYAGFLSERECLDRLYYGDLELWARRATELGLLDPGVLPAWAPRDEPAEGRYTLLSDGARGWAASGEAAIGGEPADAVLLVDPEGDPVRILAVLSVTRRDGSFRSRIPESPAAAAIDPCRLQLYAVDAEDGAAHRLRPARHLADACAGRLSVGDPE